jgi:hypothetical protein
MNEFNQLFENDQRRPQRTRSMALLVMLVSSVLASFPSAASTEEEAFAHYQNSVDGLIQSKCIVCHVSGGSYRGSDLVYVRGSSLSQQETNFGKLKNYIEKGKGNELLNRPKGNGHTNQNLNSDQLLALERLITLVEEIEDPAVDDDGGETGGGETGGETSGGESDGGSTDDSTDGNDDGLGSGGSSGGETAGDDGGSGSSDGGSELSDADGDGVEDALDNCESIVNSGQSDLDSDNLGDACDDDIDGDGVENDSDDFPEDAAETTDSDGDGVGDNEDAFDFDATESGDLDLDGIGDNTDDDDDEDGFSDLVEIEANTDPRNPYLCPDDCLRFDFDYDGKTGALTDGLIAIRYLFGFTGESLSNGAVSSAARFDQSSVEQFLQAAAPKLDIDGDNKSQALTDGLLLIRYLFGFEGDALFNGATSLEATRTREEMLVILERRTSP